MGLPRDYRVADSAPYQSGENMSPGISGSVALSGALGTGRDSLILLAALVVGVIALSYWAR